MGFVSMNSSLNLETHDRPDMNRQSLILVKMTSTSLLISDWISELYNDGRRKELFTE